MTLTVAYLDLLVAVVDAEDLGPLGPGVILGAGVWRPGQDLEGGH